MNFSKLVKKRYSCRRYQDKSPEREMIEKILEAGRLAPSAVNFQPWHFLVIDEPEMLEKIRGTYARSWFRSAPVVIVICIDHEKSWIRGDGKDHGDIDAAIAADHMTLQAVELGLDTCWVCNFDREKAEKELALPANIEAVVFLPLGYADDKPSPNHHARKEISEITHWNKFE